MHDVRVWVVLLEIKDVADVRTAKAIDRLIVVADHRDVAVLRGEEVHEHVLGPVRVLVLVDQHVAEPVAPLLERLGVGAVELDELHDQVVEIEPAGPPEHLLVGLVDPAKDLVLVAAVGDVFGPLQLALGLRDAVAQRPDRVALRVEAELVEDPLQGRPRVVIVEDDKARHDADALGLAAQDLDRRRVEGANPHLLGRLADQCLDPAPHLARRLVGEGDRQQPIRPDAARRYQVTDAGRQHARLAASRSGEDQKRSVAVCHSLLLGRIQAREQGVDFCLGRLQNHGESSLPTGRCRQSGPPSPLCLR